MILAAAMHAALAAGGDESSYAQGKRVALVMGVSSYEKLPPEAGLDSPRTEAARVAAALEQGAGFDQVRLLTDASVTLANVQEVLREQVSKEVQWRDLFFLYFVGHGVGGDFGDPRLLLYDSDPEQIETTTLAVRDLAAMMQKWVPASRYVVMTDAAHEGQVNGLALLGPTGNDWPVIGNQSFIVSSTAPRQVASPGVFSKSVVEALSGAADTNGDGAVSGSELNGFLVLAVPNATGGRQLPTVQSKYNPGIEVTRARAATAGGNGRMIAAPTHRIDRVKFNLPLGSSQRVTCLQQPPRACDPSCYVFDVPAGTCQVSATVDGVEMSGSIDVMYRGAYTCTAEASTLKCIAPPPP